MRNRQTIYFVITALLLAHCILDFDALPFWRRAGLDFLNLHLFHNCSVKDSPYLVAGSVCLDPTDRPMFYPPLLYWSFFWTRFLEFRPAYLIYAVSLCAAMGGSFFLLWKVALPATLRRHKTGAVALTFWLLMLGGMPFVFSVERGNTDPPVVFVWCLALFLFHRRHFFASGALCAAASLYKLYPAIPTVIVSAAFLLHGLKHRPALTSVIRFALGGLATSAAILLSLTSQYQIYLQAVLPVFSAQTHDFKLYSHAVVSLNSVIPHFSTIFCPLLFFLWLLCAIQNLKRDPVLIFCGALAISTFFAGTSYDYNLVTTYPLLFVLFLRARSNHGFILVLLGIAVFLGDRHFWFELGAGMRTLAQCAWLVNLPVCILIRPDLFTIKGTVPPWDSTSTQLLSEERVGASA